MVGHNEVEWFNLYQQYKNHIMPLSGGFLELSNYYINVMQIFAQHDELPDD